MTEYRMRSSYGFDDLLRNRGRYKPHEFPALRGETEFNDLRKSQVFEKNEILFSREIVGI